MFETFSTNALQMIDLALKIAREEGKQIVGTEHLLLAMYSSKESICRFLLEERNVSYEDIKKAISNLIILRKNETTDETYSRKFQEVIVDAKILSEDLESDYVYDEHIFYIILKEYDCIAYVILEKLGLDIEELIKDVEEIFNFEESKDIKPPFAFLINLTNSKMIHPYVRRKDYIEKIKFILKKKQKNNPLLIGNAGVGKTAIVEGLSKMIDQTIFQLDLGSIVSGTKYRGELEEKITKAMEYIKNKNAILFIDEIHNIVGAGSNDGSLDIANIIKPYLSRSEIKLIGATTLDEYYRFIDKDKALSRRFQNIFVDEPTEKETYIILNKIKKSYESYHNIKFTKQNLLDIINKSKLYLPRRSFPDKAIDILDEVGTRYNKTIPIKDLIDQVIQDNLGIRFPSIDIIRTIELNYPILKKEYIRFIKREDFGMFSSFKTIQVEKDFNVSYLIEDLNKLFSFKEEMFLDIDLENYIDSTSINNLIGSSKGYVGYEQGGILCEHILKYPISLVLFKNIEKAHFCVENFIKSCLEKNKFIDNKGRTIYLDNTMFLIEKRPNNKTLGFIENKQKELVTLKSKPNSKNQIIEIIKRLNLKITNIEDALKDLTNDVFIDEISKMLLTNNSVYEYDSLTKTFKSQE